ncbi:ethanolamine-phosphate cytidylyltransferase-like [Clarias magur]|uniref:Ethanolamine-phosphate cytidylyltransferase-like n=1 Tax=Clarias magur TaxID=1594786 RepID=A0A8J4WUM2_CLAMG|nr:ethanolamine-phosphate cytidylyltransferase-like [Clarias magur]
MLVLCSCSVLFRGRARTRYARDTWTAASPARSTRRWTPWRPRSTSTEAFRMIKNGHHAAQEPGGAEASHRGAEKRKRVVRVWCDGWCTGGIGDLSHY